jgi:hypothetical protein
MKLCLRINNELIKSWPFAYPDSVIYQYKGKRSHEARTAFIESAIAAVSREKDIARLLNSNVGRFSIEGVISAFLPEELTKYSRRSVNIARWKLQNKISQTPVIKISAEYNNSKALYK